MSNNEIMKKLRVALSLNNDEIIKILHLGGFEISKGALGDIFRSEDHEKFKPCGDQLLRKFLNGLIIYNRGPKADNAPSTSKKSSQRNPD